jgi:ribose 1,5-bisphosphokinase
MSQRLVYVIGPSGAGKDSVLAGLRQTWPLSNVYWARRTISRPAQADGEQHEAVGSATFAQLKLAQAFAMHWSANGLSYGVRHTELQALHEGCWVFVNGSRGWLPQLLVEWPQATVVHIGAASQVLARRLAERGRETTQDVAARLERKVPLQLPSGSICIENNGLLADAVHCLQQALLAR